MIVILRNVMIFCLVMNNEIIFMLWMFDNVRYFDNMIVFILLVSNELR